MPLTAISIALSVILLALLIAKAVRQRRDHKLRQRQLDKPASESQQTLQNLRAARQELAAQVADNGRLVAKLEQVVSRRRQEPTERNKTGAQPETT